MKPPSFGRPKTELAEFTPLGLTVLKQPGSFDQFQGLFDLAVSLANASPWCLADAYLLGEAAFGEEAAQAIVANRCSHRWLQRVVRVGRFWVLADRKRNRRRDCSFAHHEAVTGLAMNSDQGFVRACELLDRAEAEADLSAEDLEEMARTQDEPGEGEGGPDVEFSVGSLEQRLIRYHKTGQNILKDLPEGWGSERELLLSALADVDACLNSLRNRPIGEPALEAEPA